MVNWYRYSLQDICFICFLILWSGSHDDRYHHHIKTIQNISTGAARPRPLIMLTLPTRSKDDCSHFRLGPSAWFHWKLEWPISSVWMFSYLKWYFRVGHHSHSHMLSGSSLQWSGQLGTWKGRGLVSGPLALISGGQTWITITPILRSAPD